MLMKRVWNWLFRILVAAPILILVAFFVLAFVLFVWALWMHD
jgi:hypothetical protein